MAKSSKQAQRDEQDAICYSFILDRAEQINERNGVLRARAISTVYAREELFRENLQDALKLTFKDKIVVKPYVPAKKTKTGRIVNAVLSDLHFQSLLVASEVPLEYGPIEEARRLASICQQIADYKRDHRDESELYIHLLGDIIENLLHDPRDGAPIAQQVAAAIHLLTQALAFLSTQYKSVKVFTATGNHGRNTARHEKKATAQKWDSLETIIYYSIKQAVSHIPNVQVIITKTPYYTWEAFDKRGFGTHGDTVLKPGYPGQNIQVGSVSRQIDHWNASNSHMAADLFVVGHVHVGSVTHLNSGAVFMTNGALVPPNGFATSIGVFGSACGQQLFESVPGHVIGDSRFMSVGPTQDADETLDHIIKPFMGF